MKHEYFLFCFFFPTCSVLDSYCVWLLLETWQRKTQTWWQPSLLPSFPIEPCWTVTSWSSPFLSVLRRPQEPKIDADNKVQHPPMAPFSSQLCKPHCPPGNSTIVGWTALRPGQEQLRGWWPQHARPTVHVKAGTQRLTLENRSLPIHHQSLNQNKSSENHFWVQQFAREVTDIVTQIWVLVWSFFWSKWHVCRPLPRWNGCCQLAVNPTIASWCSKIYIFFLIKLHNTHHRDRSGILKQIPRSGNKVEELNLKPLRLQKMYFQAWRLGGWIKVIF